MKRVCPGVAKYSIGILVVSFAIAFSVKAQQPVASPEPARPAGETVGAKANSPATADNTETSKPERDPYDLYVFPTHRECS